MDIERLTKSQIVLLVLLVSFVTSIATGIVTVTLLEEAPPVVTQTINRVVEHTIERVVPGESQKATIIETEKTVVVNEEDLITSAIEKNTEKIVKIYKKTAEESTYIGAGVIVSKGGIVAVATDGSLLNPKESYTVLLSNGKLINGEVVVKSTESPTALLRLTFTEEDGVVPGSIKYADINGLKLGQAVFTLYGEKRTNIALGIISGIDEEDVKIEPLEGSEEEIKFVSVLQAVETNINGNNIEKGGVLLNLFGDVVGISTSASRLGGLSNFTPIQVVQSQIIELSIPEGEVLN
jgi:S1-C subfamily serine protease